MKPLGLRPLISHVSKEQLSERNAGKCSYQEVNPSGAVTGDVPELSSLKIRALDGR